MNGLLSIYPIVYDIRNLHFFGNSPFIPSATASRGTMNIEHLTFDFQGDLSVRIPVMPGYKAKKGRQTPMKIEWIWGEF